MQWRDGEGDSWKAHQGNERVFQTALYVKLGTEEISWRVLTMAGLESVQRELARLQLLR